MLHEKPDVDRLLGFIARCRQSDGSYASAAHRRYGRNVHGHDRDPVAASLERHAARRRNGRSHPLVNGDDLSGWEGDRKLWSAKDGVLAGVSPGIDHNEFLATTRPFGDFILHLDFRLLGGKGNSGVQFRSVRVPPHEMSGYQADIGEGYWGSLYDESRRNKTLVPGSQDALKVLNKTDWNHYTVRPG